jgi:hypothetical protein
MPVLIGPNRVDGSPRLRSSRRPLKWFSARGLVGLEYLYGRERVLPGPVPSLAKGEATQPASSGDMVVVPS